MMKKKNKYYGLSLIGAFALTAMSQPAVSAPTTPANQDQIRIHTGTPKKNGETLFSYTVTWRIDGGLTYRSTGLTFIQGPDKPHPTVGTEIGKKIVIALNDAMEYLYPSWRGANVQQPEGKEEVILSNNQGFDFTDLTFRDYSNQELTYDLMGKTFSAANVGIAIDIVYAADVENIAEFNPGKPKNASGGTITVRISNKEPVSVKTDGKSLDQIEKDLARALGGIAKFSATPIFPNIKDETTRNYKPFDGGEVQLIGLSADSISIDINDPSLGTLTKFQFPDTNKPTEIASYIPYIVYTGAGIAVLYFFFTWYMQSKKEEDENNTSS